MTETADIKALRDVKRWGLVLTGAEFPKFVTAEIATGPYVKQEDYFNLLELLKAERQRTCEMTEQYLDRNSALTSATLRYEKAEAELAALRGEQDHGDSTVYMMPNVFASLVNTARDVALEYKNAQCLRDALSRELKGYFTFTRQPKPVVVLNSSTVMSRSYVVKQIEASGIVVKDGE